MRTCALLSALLFAACGPGVAPPGSDGGTDAGPAPYPGPYGVNIGEIIHNYQVTGFPGGTADTTTLQPIAMGDFYNPTGTDTFPTGSPYGAGQPKPLALLIDRGAIWCAPCNTESKTDLPPKHTQFFPQGQFLFSLDEGATPGVAPTQDNLKSWVNAYAVDYPAVLNPDYVFAPIVGQDAYPANIIVRTKDMKIVTWINGPPTDAMWQLFAETIDGGNVLP